MTGRRGGLLRQRDFRLFWTGESISEVGNSVTIVVIPLVAIDTLHASTFIVTLLTAMVWLPWVIIGIPAGAWVDRYHPGPSCWPVMRSRWRCTRACLSPPGAGC
jgi:MFS family permease